MQDRCITNLGVTNTAKHSTLGAPLPQYQYTRGKMAIGLRGIQLNSTNPNLGTTAHLSSSSGAPGGGSGGAAGGAGGDGHGSAGPSGEKGTSGGGSGAGGGGGGASSSTGGGPYGETFLRSKFQVGSCKSDKTNFMQNEKVFHSGDIPDNVLACKKTVLKSKYQSLGVNPRDAWNISVKTVSASPGSGENKNSHSSLRETLQKVRAGLMDQKTLNLKSKGMSEEEIADRIRYIVAITGRGPIGKFVGRWWNGIDERGLAAHCVAPEWPDWDAGSATHTMEDVKQAEQVFLRKEERRLRMNQIDEKVNFNTYDSLIERYLIKNKDIEDRKIEYQELKDLFKHELRIEFPTSSEDRLQSMAQRLLDEKLLSDIKLKRFPVQHESFKPNLSVTTQDRRYKSYYHPGSWSFNKAEGRWCWSCCMNYKEDSRGCCSRSVNPDRWCLDGFERAGLHV